MSAPVETERIPDEQRLYEELFFDYEPSVRPLSVVAEKILVNFKLILNQIVDMVELIRMLIDHIST